MVIGKIRPKYIERPQSPQMAIQPNNDNDSKELSLSDLIEYSRKKKAGVDMNKIQDAPVMTIKEYKSTLEDAPDKVASSGHLLSDTGGDGSKYTGYRAMNPIYDYHTSNKSFIKVHKQLEILGVRNNEFFLLLLNPRLQGVDPHDPNISPELALMVIEECQLNFFYYLREVVRIPQQGAGVVPFELDRATLASAYCFINDINNYLIKPRQTGKSVGICAFMSWVTERLICPAYRVICAYPWG